jgi:cytochrome P450
MQDLNYFSMCFNESLRIESPASVTIDYTFREDVTLGNKYKIKKGDALYTFTW